MDKSAARQDVKQLWTPIDNAKPGRILALLQTRNLSCGLAMSIGVRTLNAHQSIYSYDQVEA